MVPGSTASTPSNRPSSSQSLSEHRSRPPFACNLSKLGKMRVYKESVATHFIKTSYKTQPGNSGDRPEEIVQHPGAERRILTHPPMPAALEHHASRARARGATQRHGCAAGVRILGGRYHQTRPLP